MAEAEIVEAVVEGLNEYGEGFFHHKNHLIKIARSVPGDRIRVQIPILNKHFVRGEALELVLPSENRITEELCPHFRVGEGVFSLGCGGCQWLHVSYPEQLRAKAAIVRDLLFRHGGMKVSVLPVLGMSNPTGYRNKMSLINIKGRMAFKQEYSEEPVYPVVCRQETALNIAVWAKLRNLELPSEVLQVHLRSAGGRVGILLFVRHYTPGIENLAKTIKAAHSSISGVGAASYREFRLLWGADDLLEDLGGIRYGIALNGFFQTNYAQALIICNLALAQLAPSKSDRILDVFCGSGFFSLPLAIRAESVLGIENNRDSIRAASFNAKRNRIGNTRFISADAATALHGLNPGMYRLALLDPPRAGCGPQLLSEIIRLMPEKIVYVSCSPESLATDLSVLCKSAYRVTYCQPVDMFPHTFHIETLVTLVRAGGS